LGKGLATRELRVRWTVGWTLLCRRHSLHVHWGDQHPQPREVRGHATQHRPSSRSRFVQHECDGSGQYGRCQFGRWSHLDSSTTSKRHPDASTLQSVLSERHRLLGSGSGGGTSGHRKRARRRLTGRHWNVRRRADLDEGNLLGSGKRAELLGSVVSQHWRDQLSESFRMLGTGKRSAERTIDAHLPLRGQRCAITRREQRRFLRETSCDLSAKWNLFRFRLGTQWARNPAVETDDQSLCPSTWGVPVVGTGVDPVTSRFSGESSNGDARKAESDLHAAGFKGGPGVATPLPRPSMPTKSRVRLSRSSSTVRWADLTSLHS
jgi:hypothetical protein